MKKICLCFLLLLFACETMRTQVPHKIKIKKEKDQFYFYQKGNKTDTITKSSGNIFYFIVSDAAKPDVSLFVENGQLLKTSNDSLYIFRYVKGMSYECLFKILDGAVPPKKAKFEFTILVNGVTTEPPGSVIIRLKEKNEPGFAIENRFYYKE